MSRAWQTLLMMPLLCASSVLQAADKPPVVPDGAEAVTGATVAQENSDAVQKDLKVVGILFMIFAGIALFVGAFIIWNTFTMIVTQRSREIALLRAIGLVYLNEVSVTTPELTSVRGAAVTSEKPDM